MNPLRGIAIDDYAKLPNRPFVRAIPDGGFDCRQQPQKSPKSPKSPKSACYAKFTEIKEMSVASYQTVFSMSFKCFGNLANARELATYIYSISMH